MDKIIFIGTQGYRTRTLLHCLYLIFDEWILYFQVLGFFVVCLFSCTKKKTTKQKTLHWGWRNGSTLKITFAALAEYSNSDPSIHIRQLAITHNSSLGGPNTLFWVLKALSCAHMQTHHTHTNKKKSFLKENFAFQLHSYQAPPLPITNSSRTKQKKSIWQKNRCKESHEQIASRSLLCGGSQLWLKRSRNHLAPEACEVCGLDWATQGPEPAKYKVVVCTGLLLWSILESSSQYALKLMASGKALQWRLGKEDRENVLSNGVQQVLGNWDL